MNSYMVMKFPSVIACLADIEILSHHTLIIGIIKIMVSVQDLCLIKSCVKQGLIGTI